MGLLYQWPGCLQKEALKWDTASTLVAQIQLSVTVYSVIYSGHQKSLQDQSHNHFNSVCSYSHPYYPTS